jgi:hypothetical protein
VSNLKRRLDRLGASLQPTERLMEKGGRLPADIHDAQRSNEQARSSPVLEAVRQATPESRAAFEAQYGTIPPELQIVASVEQGGWVEVLKLEEDGTVTKVRHEGGTPEAERLREEARNQGPAF